MDERSLIILREQVNMLVSTINRQVVDAYMRIWPDKGWPNDSDTELILYFENGSNEVLSKKFGLAKDQETIILRDERAIAEHSFNDINNRISHWSSLDDQSNPQPRDWEYFSLVGSSEYGWIMQNSIASVTMYLMLPFMIPTDLKLSFNSGDDIWIMASSVGCRIEMSDIDKSRQNYALLILDSNSVPL